MKIVTLIENRARDGEDLHKEHGLSIYLEIDGKSILFDTGQSGSFIDNARKLDVDLHKLDYVIISHGHYDHSGGFEKLINEINPDIKLYVGNGFFNKKYGLLEEGDYEYTGNPFGEDFLERKNIPIEYVKDDMLNITENLFVFTNFTRDEEFENTNQDMYLREGEKYVKDMFLDEISLAIRSNEGLVIVVGCSHVGIVNILDTISKRTSIDIYGLLGGTHLVKEDDEKINKIIDYLKEKDIQVIGACHCTGKHGETMLKQQLDERFLDNNTGHTLEFILCSLKST